MQKIWDLANQGQLKQIEVQGLPRNILRTFKDPAAPSFTFVLHVPTEKLSSMNSTFTQAEGFVLRVDWMKDQPVVVVLMKDKHEPPTSA